MVAHARCEQVDAPFSEDAGDHVARTFAPLPARALADIRLSALDLRVLAVIAAHDRFGKNGIGCYASHPRLASIVQCHLKSLSRCLKALGEHGYIEAMPHPVMKRLRVYRVIYSDEDRAVLSRPIDNETATNAERVKGNDLVTEGRPIGNETAPQDARTGNRGGYPKDITRSVEDITGSVEKSPAEAVPAQKEEESPTCAREAFDLDGGRYDSDNPWSPESW